VNILKAFKSGRSNIIRQFAVMQPVTSPLQDLGAFKISTGCPPLNDFLWESSRTRNLEGAMWLVACQLFPPNPSYTANRITTFRFLAPLNSYGKLSIELWDEYFENSRYGWRGGWWIINSPLYLLSVQSLSTIQACYM
jgi:hypothetical protein